MATSLGSQLKALALGREPVGGRIRTRASLLFDPKKAADIDVQTIFSLAEAGLEELCSMENGRPLEAYKSTLLSVQSVQTDRELQSKEFNKELNESISTFLRLLSGFILLPACHQVLEYLIRRYKIHVYNVEDIMITILPYHETSIFVRIVQLLHLEKTRWSIFAGVKKNGAAPPRNVLVQRCSHDMGFLEAVCNSGLNPSAQSRIHATFSSVVLMEVLLSVTIISTDMVVKILPFIMDALKQDVIDEFRVGSIMVIGVMVKRASLAPKTTLALAAAIANMIGKGTDASCIRLGMLAMVEITQTQEVDHLPRKACKSLIKARDSFHMIAELSKQYNTDKLIALLLKSLCDRLAEQGLLEAAQTLPLQKHVHSLVLSLIQKAGLDDGRRVLKNVLLALDKRFPEELDICIKSLLESDQDRFGADFVDVLEEVFRGSLRRPVKESNSTLYSSIDHPEVAVRQAALSSIAALVKMPLDAKAAHFVQEALLRRLDDEDLAVVQTVLSLDGLKMLVPEGELLTAILRLVKRCMELLETGSESSSLITKEVLQSCLDTLEGCTELDPNFVKELQSVLVSYLLLQPKTQDVNSRFLRVSHRFPVFLFAALPKFEEQNEEAMTKEQVMEYRFKRNQQIIAGLSDAVSKDSSSMQLLLESASVNIRAKLVASLVILRTFERVSTGDMRDLSKKCFSFLSCEWTSITTEAKRTPRAMQEIIRGSDYDQAALYKRIEKNPSKAYVEAVLRSLYKVVQVLLPLSIVTSEDKQIAEDLFCFFAGASDWRPFLLHIGVLIERLSTGAVLFISRFFMPELPLPEVLQGHSVDIVTACYEESLALSEQLQTSVPCVLVALGSPVKSVRKGAITCMKAMLRCLNEWDDPSSESLKLLFELIIDVEEAFVENMLFFRSFFENNLGGDEMKDNGLSDEACKSVVAFLLQHVDKLPRRVQINLFEVLLDVGYSAEKAQVTQPVLLQLLKRRRLSHLNTTASLEQRLSSDETCLIELLLKMNIQNLNQLFILGKNLDNGEGENYPLWSLLEALDVDGGLLKDEVVMKPCLAALKLLLPDFYNRLDSRAQDSIFVALVTLAAVPDDIIRPAAQQTLDMLAVTSRTVSNCIQSLQGTPKKTKRAKLLNSQRTSKLLPREKIASVSASLLDFLLRTGKKEKWVELLELLFHLLREHIAGNWPGSMNTSEKEREFLGQLVLAVLEGILSSATTLEDTTELDIDTLMQCVRKAPDGAMRRNALAVLTASAKLRPELVSGRAIEIFSVVGVSTISLEDGHTHKIIEELLEAVVPAWIRAAGHSKALLQIFVDVLPQVPVPRRVALMRSVMRVANEETSIPTFLLLLISHTALDKSSERDWALDFSEEFCASYAPNTRAVVLFKFSNELLQMDLQTDPNFWTTSRRGMYFLARQVQRLQMRNLESDIALNASRSIMEHALKQLQVLDDKRLPIPEQSRESSLEAARVLLESVTKSMSPLIFCQTVSLLLQEPNDALCRKVLQIYISKLKSSEVVSRKNAGADFTTDSKPHVEMTTQVLKLLNRQHAGLSSRTKQVAVLVLEIIAARFAATSSATFVSLLPSLVESFESPNGSLAAGCIRCAASTLTTVGPESLPNLGAVMNGLLKRAKETGTSQQDSSEVQSAILLALEAAVDKLGGFMNPYIEDILSLVILHGEYNDPSGINYQRVTALRSLIADRIPVRLLLDPLMKVYRKTLENTEESAAAVFKILARLCSKLERASVAAFHTKIFGFCMEALDIRRKQPVSFSSVQLVEESVIGAIVALVMKLSEKSFKPLFIAVHNWAESTTLDGTDSGPSIERSIVFFKLVNELTEKLRSVFVPYFSYLLEGCVSRLSTGEEVKKKKKKKARLDESGSVLAKWHLQQLVISALHKCFLYDTVNFLDGPRFQQLLQPLASKLVAEIPSELETLKDADVPTAKEADDELVSCLVRLALRAGSDLYWKPLNHEVLMHTRNESQRAKLLALEVVKSLASNLKEEFMVLIAETLPFLAELLEQDLVIQAKAQEVFKLLEEVSGENLSQYL